MNENQIQEQLKQNIPQPEVSVIAPVAPVPQERGADVPLPTELDMLTQYKLHDYFGAPFGSVDEDSKSQARYIFDTVAAQLGTNEYVDVVQRIRDLERIAGTAHSDRRIYNLYQWLRLDALRRTTEREMSLIGEVNV